MNCFTVKRNPHVQRTALLVVTTLILSQVFGCTLTQPLGTSALAPNQTPVNAPQKTPESGRARENKIVNPDLERNRRLWLESKIINYDMTIQAHVGGNVIPAESVIIEVRDNKSTLIEPDPRVDEVRLRTYRKYATINEMFDAIQNGFDEDAIVEVKYNTKYGYPEEWYVNYHKKGSDQYQRTMIKRFEVVPAIEK